MSPLVATTNANNTNRQGSISSIRSVQNTPSIIATNNCLNNSYKNRGWSATCLRPAPPLRPCLALGSTPNGSPVRSNHKPTSYKEDALILEVIEAYCTAIKPRNAVNSGTFV